MSEGKINSLDGCKNGGEYGNEDGFHGVGFVFLGALNAYNVKETCELSTENFDERMTRGFLDIHKTSKKQALDHVAVHIGKAEVTTLIAVSEFPVINSQ